MDLKSLKKEVKKLTESESGALGDGKVVDAAGAPEGGGPIANKGFKSGKPVGFQSVDSHSKPVQKVSRENGVNAAVKEFKPEGGEMKGAKETVKTVSREQGVAAGVKEVGKGDKNIGTKEIPGKDTRVARDEGAGAGAKEVGEYGNMSAFRSKVRSAFGLSLDDKMNKGNDGLNKKSLGESRLNEMNGMPSASEIRAAQKKFKSHLSSNPQIQKQLADLEAQKESLTQQEEAITRQIISIERQIMDIRKTGGYFA